MAPLPRRSAPDPDAAQLHLHEALEALVQQTMRIARGEAAAAGLSLPQYFVLRRILREGVLPATSWARQAGTRASSASGLVDGLVRNRWVLRARDPQDRRRVLLRLSPVGERLVERVSRARRRRIQGVLDGLRPSEVRRAAGMLDTLAQRLSESDPAARRTRPTPRRPVARPTAFPATRSEVAHA